MSEIRATEPWTEPERWAQTDRILPSETDVYFDGVLIAQFTSSYWASVFTSLTYAVKDEPMCNLCDKPILPWEESDDGAHGGCLADMEYDRYKAERDDALS